MQSIDSRPRACSHRSLFVRRIPTRPRAKGQKPHFTQRLVRSVRCGSRVRQRTLRNLGRHVALPRGDGPALCARVERILAPPPPSQRSLEFGACSPAVEDEAQRSALGEPFGCDFETMGRNALQRASDRLLRHRETIGTRLLQRTIGLFDLQPTVTLHDRTSTCFEGAADRQPLEGSGATHPGVHGLRTHSVGWDAERLWRTCVTRTDLEAVLRSLGSGLGPRPIHHRRPARSAGHLCLSVLACQLVRVVRQRLRAGGETASQANLQAALEPLLAPDAVLVTDGGAGCPGCARSLGVQHEAVNRAAGQRVRGSHPIQTVNQRHRQLQQFLLPFHGVADEVPRQLPALASGDRSGQPALPAGLPARLLGPPPPQCTRFAN